MTTATEKQPTPQQTEPVDVLVEMAREGEIDPWDIDIVDVTDKFLERLEEGDLVRTGRALLYASILLRMKSDYVVEEDEEEETEGWDDWRADAPHDDVPFDDNIDALEAEFERRLDRRKVRDRTRPETLDELVRELRERERGSWWKESREYDTSPDEGMVFRPERPAPTTEDAMQTAHEDDIEDRVDDVRERLAQEFEHRDEILFAELRGDTKRETVTNYIALQFLAMRDGVHLEQDEFYGDLWIKSD
ncbi:MAG: ScpA family protein [Halobacteriales archaeon]|nr:ScpA family protein [Halobacteriales archaeon]